MILKNLPQIKNIIFDLGNVVIDLDTEATDDAFQYLYGPDHEDYFKELKEKNIFKKYEKGLISTQTFLNELMAFDDSITIDEIKNAWNAMLLDIPKINYTILEKAKRNYRTFCLSNTNRLHIEFINKQLSKKRGIPNLNQYFEKIYLSHEMNMRKPDAETFETIIKEQQLKKNETLFIDDTIEHIEGAKSVGLHTIHLDDTLSLSDLFDF